MAGDQRTLQLFFPRKGVSENEATSVQPPETTRRAMNMRGQDPVTGRDRGAQRAGTSQAFGGFKVAGENVKVTELQSVIYPLEVKQYSQKTEPTEPSVDWFAAPGSSQIITALDASGNVYSLGEDAFIRKYSSTGGLITEREIPLNEALPIPSTGVIPTALAIGLDESIFVATQDLDNLPAGGGPGRLIKYTKNFDGSYDEAWSWAVFGKGYVGSPSQGTGTQLSAHITALSFGPDGDLYAAYWQGTATTNSPWGVLRLTDLLTAEAVLVNSDTPVPLPVLQMVAIGTREVYVAMHYIGDVGSPTYSDVSYDLAKIDTTQPELSNSIVWSVNGLDGSAPLYPGGLEGLIAGPHPFGGGGFGVAVDGDGFVLSCGPPTPGTSADLAEVRKWSESFGAPVEEWSADFSAISATPIGFEDDSIRLSVDAFGNAYVPLQNAGLSDPIFGVFASEDGAVVIAPSVSILGAFTAGPEVYSIAVPPPPNVNEPSIETAELVYVGHSGSSGIDGTLSAVRLIDVTQLGLRNPRAIRLLTIGGGNIRLAESGSVITIDSGGEYTGESRLDVTSGMVMCTEHFGKVYITDGSRYLVYDPRPPEAGGDTATGSVRPWQPGSGSLPENCRIIETWQGRVILAGDGHNWYMSAIGNALDWDYFPPVTTEIDAVSGNTSLAGNAPDRVTGLIPWTDDVLVVGGDKTIWLLRGNPNKAGEFDLLSSTTGMAFGRAWTKDPSGNIYFLGSKGGLFRLTMQGIERLGLGRVERSLQDDFDLTDRYVRMEWNYRDETLHIFQYPYSVFGHSSQVRSWVWDSKLDAFWPDTWSVAESMSHQPTASEIVDGDSPDDRAMYLGLGDGSIVKWDDEAVNDAGRLIHSSVDMGPFTPGDGQRYRFNQLYTRLAYAQNGATCEMFAQDVSDFPDAPPRHTVPLPAGDSPHYRRPLGGNVVYLRLSNGALYERWSYETGSIRAQRVGRARRTARQ